MCPERERYDREEKQDISVFEADAGMKSIRSIDLFIKLNRNW
jgi:hypothetical protein